LSLLKAAAAVSSAEPEPLPELVPGSRARDARRPREPFCGRPLRRGRQRPRRRSLRRLWRRAARGRGPGRQEEKEEEEQACAPRGPELRRRPRRLCCAGRPRGTAAAGGCSRRGRRQPQRTRRRHPGRRGRLPGRRDGGGLRLFAPDPGRSHESMDDELRVLRQQCSQLHEEVLFATAEHQLASEQKQACESQLQRARYQAELLRRRRTTSLEKAGVTGERSLCLDELQFLEELQALSEQELLEINRLNSSVQAQVSASEAIAQPLEARRREALLEVAAERRRQRRDLLALRRAEAELEQLRGEPSGERARRLRAAVRRAELAVAEDPSAARRPLRRARRAGRREGGARARNWPRPSAGRLPQRRARPGGGGGGLVGLVGRADEPVCGRRGGRARGLAAPPPRPTQFDQIFEDRAPEPDHLRRHLAAGRASSGPLDV
ncbi:unnamed protein product, partial [Prorocentrum cordatum]